MSKEANQWHGCYDDGWKGQIVPEAFSHPAKMAYGLLNRIYDHAFEQGWLKAGDVVADPFGGVGTTAIIGAYRGVQVCCCELEKKFVLLAEENFALHRRKWEKLGCPMPVIVQGDSRELHKHLMGVADIIVSSPPFAEAQTGGGIAKALTGESDYPLSQQGGKYQGYRKDHQCSTPGNLGALKPGDVAMVVSSPPYQECVKANGDRIDWSKVKEGGTKRTLARKAFSEAYGTTKGNLGNLKPGDVAAIISSPPYEGSDMNSCITGQNSQQPRKYSDHTTGYGRTKGQLGGDKGPTFWQAAKEIVAQCHHILKPGGHAIWVVKAFVRKGRIVDFPGDWRRLCESVGLETVCLHHAMLVKETTQYGLFGEIKEKTERKSFFRRLAESKGSPKIDYEVVICTRKAGS